MKTLTASPEKILLLGEENAPSKTQAGGGALAGLALSMLLASLGISIANVALPTFSAVFAATFQEVQWIVLAYLLCSTISLVAVGRLGDRIGARRLLLAGLLLFTVAAFGCGAAPSLAWLIAARALQGLGAAILLALSLALVGGAMPRDRVGSSMGLLGAMSAIGTALGPSLGGFLLSGPGWRAIFFVQVPLGLLAFVFAARCLPGDSREPMSRPSPALPFGEVLRHPGLVPGLILSLIVSAVLMATLVVGPFYLTRSLGLGAGLLGLALSVGPLVAASTGFPAGRLVDRFGAHEMVSVGLCGIGAGCISLVLLPAFGLPGYLFPIAGITASYALFQAANNTAVLGDLGPDRRGLFSGLLNLSRQLGLIAGTSALGAVFALAAGSEPLASAPPAAVATGMRATFGCAALLIAGALVLARFQKSVRN